VHLFTQCANHRLTSFSAGTTVGAQTYRLQVATDATFASGIVVNDSTITDSLKAMSGLANSTIYYWRLNAKNVAGTGPYSAAWAFSTIVANPATPVLVSPADGATNQDLSVKYVWRKVTGATSYRLQVTTDARSLQDCRQRLYDHGFRRPWAGLRTTRSITGV
jgi:hypothetical protein